jgi:hypothetical protein
MGGRKTITTSTSLTTTMSGDAVAVGDNTLVTGTTTVKTTDVGPVTKTSGKTTFTATAQSSDGDTTYAAAYTYADAEGEDLLISRTQTSTGTNHMGNQTTMTAISSTSVFALDIEQVDLPIGPITIDRMVEQEEDCDAAAIDGNVALFDVEIQAYGEDTYAGLEAFVLTTDDFSTVTASAISIA